MIFVLGSITGTLGEGILFYMQFLLLRGYAGGIHASKETTCILCTTVMLTLSILLLRAITVMKMSVIPLGILLFCGMVVYFMSPLETIEKPLTKEERYHFGRMTKILVVCNILLSILTKCAGYSFLLNSSTVCMALESMLLITGRIKNTKIRM